MTILMSQLLTKILSAVTVNLQEIKSVGIPNQKLVHTNLYKFTPWSKRYHRYATKHNVSMSGLSFYKILNIYLKTLSWFIQREAIDTRKSNLASYIKIAFNCICFLQRCFNECMLAWMLRHSTTKGNKICDNFGFRYV